MKRSWTRLPERKTQRMVLAILLVVGLRDSAANAGVLPETYRIGLSSNMFTDVRKTDALASIKLWADSHFSAKGMNITSELSMFDDLETLRRGLKEDRLDMATLLAEEALELHDLVDLDHLLLISLSGDCAQNYLLLTRTDSGLDNLAALKGKGIGIAEHANQGMGRRWLETRVMQLGSRGMDHHFGSSEPCSKISKAIMSVFFGKLDACLVKRSGFETMVELNPQIGKTLQVVEESPRFVYSVLCLRKDLDRSKKKAMIASMSGDLESTGGKQVQTVLGVDGMIEGCVEDLALVGEWLNLQAALRHQLAMTEDVE